MSFIRNWIIDFVSSGQITKLSLAGYLIGLGLYVLAIVIVLWLGHKVGVKADIDDEEWNDWI